MTNEQAIQILKNMTSNQRIMTAEMYEALDMAIKTLQEKPKQYNVFFADKNHAWINGKQYVSLRRFEEVKKQVQEELNRSDTIYRQDATDACIRVRELRAYDEIEEIKTLPSATKLEAKELQDVKVERNYWKQRAKYAERPKGEWIDLDEYQIMDWMSKNKCSICGKITFGELKNYCPHCGADMRGEG